MSEGIEEPAEEPELNKDGNQHSLESGVQDLRESHQDSSTSCLPTLLSLYSKKGSDWLRTLPLTEELEHT